MTKAQKLFEDLDLTEQEDLVEPRDSNFEEDESDSIEELTSGLVS